MPQYDIFTSWFFETATCRVKWGTGLKEQLEWSDDEVIRLSGAPARSEVEVQQFDLSKELAGGAGTGIRLSVTNDILLQEPIVRDVLITTEGTLLTSALYNKVFCLRPQFRGLRLGPRSCAIEIFQAKALEFDYIDVWAVGNPAHSRDRNDEYAMSGFAVWPRLGFDADIPEQVHAKLPPDMIPGKLTRISELMATQRGVQFWDANGDECKLRFELANDVCWRTLQSYLDANDIQVTL